jgi:hypothetical protein
MLLSENMISENIMLSADKNLFSDNMLSYFLFLEIFTHSEAETAEEEGRTGRWNATSYQWKSHSVNTVCTGKYKKKLGQCIN